MYAADSTESALEARRRFAKRRKRSPRKHSNNSQSLTACKETLREIADKEDVKDSAEWEDAEKARIPKADNDRKERTLWNEIQLRF